MLRWSPGSSPDSATATTGQSSHHLPFFNFSLKFSPGISSSRPGVFFFAGSLLDFLTRFMFLNCSASLIFGPILLSLKFREFSILKTLPYRCSTPSYRSRKHIKWLKTKNTVHQLLSNTMVAVPAKCHRYIISSASSQVEWLIPLAKL